MWNWEPTNSLRNFRHEEEEPGCSALRPCMTPVNRETIDPSRARGQTVTCAHWYLLFGVFRLFYEVKWETSRLCKAHWSQRWDSWTNQRYFPEEASAGRHKSHTRKTVAAIVLVFFSFFFYVVPHKKSPIKAYSYFILRPWDPFPLLDHTRILSDFNWNVY